jgi:hypothetical protein
MAANKILHDRLSAIGLRNKWIFEMAVYSGSPRGWVEHKVGQADKNPFALRREPH